MLLAVAGVRGAAGMIPDEDWRDYGKDSARSHYSTLEQIGPGNVNQLHVAWRFHAGGSDTELRTAMECTPLVISGVMYVTSPVLNVIALEAATGREIWRYNPFPERPSYHKLWISAGLLFLLLGVAVYAAARLLRRRRGFLPVALLILLGIGAAGGALAFSGSGASSFKPVHRFLARLLPDPRIEQRHLGPNRGLTYWEAGSDRRIFFAGGHRLVALDARTGKPVPSFGTQGIVDLTHGLDRKVERGQLYTVTSPGVIYKNLIVIGSTVSEGPGPVASGDIRAFDVRSGQQRWTLHTVPLPGKPGSETWPRDAHSHIGGVNAWAGMTVDEARGMLFIPVGSAAFDYYGGDRHGQNLFSDSLLAVAAESGHILWHYQMVHHDLWDYDLPCPPVLTTVNRNGSRIDAVVQPTKQGFVFVLDREHGQPLFPVEERPVPASDVPGEQAWPTQPFPLQPAALSRGVITANDLTNLSPEAHAQALQQLQAVAGASLFLPPSRRGSIVTPGFQGGANWGGPALDPATGTLILNTSDIPYLLHIVAAKAGQGYPYTVRNYDDPFVDREGYPAIKPPWGKLSAIDLNTGNLLWQVPLGEYKALTKRGIPPTGTANIGGPLLTRGGLLFIGATKDRMFRAFDAHSGRLLWETELPAAGHATPMTYAVAGKQYVVIAAGGGSIAESSPSSDTYIAFSL